MLARLRENLSFKLLALIAAIMLHAYVSSQQNPSQTKTVTIPIAVKNLPPGLLMAGKPGMLMVNLTGASEDLAKIADMNVAASVDLRHARIGPNAALPLDVELTPASIKTTVAVDYRPKTLSIELDEKRRRKLPISVEVSGTSAPGFVTRRPSLLVPSLATATGPADEVDSIVRLVVKPDVTGATDTVDDDFQIMPVDAQGNDIANVQLTPDTAHVQIGVVETGRTKEVFVTPKFSGVPAAGFVVSGVVVKPETITLSGNIDQLAAAMSVSTEPVDISGASTSITKQVRCVPPAGVISTPAQMATVTVQIVPAAPAIPPAQPAPAAPVVP